MFYSHEILTSRKYGVATVWLVATLGSKSSLKKVSRKSILDVDVEKACHTIMEPDVPLALRLQSNLLVGVTRVYLQQCGYVLSDAEAARNNMRTILKVVQNSNLEAEGGHKGRSDQLILHDDPNFLPDFDLMPMDLDQLNIDISTMLEESQRSTLSPHSSQRSIGSQEVIGGLQIPGQSSSFVSGPVGSLGGSFGTRGYIDSGQKIDNRGFLDDDLGIIVDPDGTLHFDDAPNRGQASTTVERNDRTTLAGGINSHLGHEDANIRLGTEMPDQDAFMILQDDIVPAEADQFINPGTQGRLQQETTSETALAPMQRRSRTAKVIAPDTTLELRNADLARWNNEYVENMHDAMKHKLVSRAIAIAKNNAELWVLGTGASSLAALGQADRLVQGPLEMFSGAKLLEALTGVKLLTNREKRIREEDLEGEVGRRVRSRGLEPLADEIARGGFDDAHMPAILDEDTGVEHGREGPTPLDDRHLSSAFPWNQSTGSRRPTGVSASASIVGTARHLSLFGHRGSRLPSGSPLTGRGLPGTTAGDDELQQGFSSDQIGGDFGITALDEFELYGTAAHVDSQTAQQSQWVRAALDSESVNFLAFVRSAIEEADQVRNQLQSYNEEELGGSIDFETLLPAHKNSRIVAAQGLLHVLALGTKGMLQVKQNEAFGAINMRIMGI